jgi:putative DNA primase/helicase
LTIWNSAEPITNTPAAAYLDWRGVLEPALAVSSDVLRFHRACPFGEGIRHPCMIALMRDIGSNKPRAIQRTALMATLMQAIAENTHHEFVRNGGRVARKMLGSTTGTAIKVSADEDVALGLTIGEGLESVLAAMVLGFRPAWALGGTSGVRTFPLLNGSRR